MATISSFPQGLQTIIIKNVYRKEVWEDLFATLSSNELQYSNLQSITDQISAIIKSWDNNPIERNTQIESLIGDIGNNGLTKIQKIFMARFKQN